MEIPAGSVLRSALAGGLSCALSTSLMHPIDTIKANFYGLDLVILYSVVVSFYCLQMPCFSLASDKIKAFSRLFYFGVSDSCTSINIILP